ncbi:hypothetical protein HDE_13585 [Halotydeus destructor]|nr:hypothetical protein HDE_13585 [Halotydeus destructor]
MSLREACDQNGNDDPNEEFAALAISNSDELCRHRTEDGITNALFEQLYSRLRCPSPNIHHEYTEAVNLVAREKSKCCYLAKYRKELELNNSIKRAKIAAYKTIVQLSQQFADQANASKDLTCKKDESNSLQMATRIDSPMFALSETIFRLLNFDSQIDSFRETIFRDYAFIFHKQCSIFHEKFDELIQTKYGNLSHRISRLVASSEKLDKHCNQRKVKRSAKLKSVELKINNLLEDYLKLKDTTEGSELFMQSMNLAQITAPSDDQVQECNLNPIALADEAIDTEQYEPFFQEALLDSGFFRKLLLQGIQETKQQFLYCETYSEEVRADFLKAIKIFARDTIAAVPFVYDKHWLTPILLNYKYYNIAMHELKSDKLKQSNCTIQTTPPFVAE